MNRKSNFGFLFLFAITSSAVGQEVKSFPEASCAYKLPANDWEWLDPRLASKNPGKVLAFAKSQGGQGFVLSYEPLRQGQNPNANSFQSFEAGVFEAKTAKKLAGNRINFKGIQAYQIDAEIPGGYGMSIRIMWANNNFYNLQAIYDLDRFSTKDADTIFNGFEFTGQPVQVPMGDPAAENGRMVGNAIGSLIFVAVIVFAFLWFIKKRANNTGLGVPDAKPSGETEVFNPSKRWKRGRFR